jgi:uncharacterized delta-60 repeat protein
MKTQERQQPEPGDLDTSFADRGIYTFDGGLIHSGYAVTALANNQLLISATHFPNLGSYALIKMNEDGSLDKSFGSDNSGIVHRFFLEQFSSHAGSCVVLPDDHLMLSGVYTKTPGAFSAAITRLNADGEPDLSFGVAGVTTVEAPLPEMSGIPVPEGGNSDPWEVRNTCHLTPLSDGRTLISKNFISPFASGPAPYSILGKLSSTGHFDKTFQERGYTYIQPELNNIVDQHLVQADGKIIVAGHLAEAQTAYLARFDQDGNIDTGFGVNGYIEFTEPLGNLGFVTALVPHSENKFLLITNFTTDFPNNNGQIRSFNADGSPDLMFNQGLAVDAKLPNLDRSVEWRNAVEDEDGLIVLGDIQGIVVARYFKTGLLDLSFGTNLGWTALLAGRAFDLARQVDGKIVVIGQDARQRSIVARFWGLENTEATAQRCNAHTHASGAIGLSWVCRLMRRFTAGGKAP